MHQNTKANSFLALAPHLVEVAELPEEDQQLLVELDLLGGSRQVRLDQRVVHQPGQTFQDEAQVLRNQREHFKGIYVTLSFNILLNAQWLLCFTSSLCILER